ncbi:bifunctional alpha,alpha-trehalose-phosphate synthase (UDP-forming)/trehalose-phosphatase [Oligoflexus tunisiensis]|uniref:bifunctional alpha,alpha-trehalose-phosphate synthase (UDP-forming)/trehalose-phosphatase n=1 Tax=Oligoflexus tunisiensis TaxID=708132 RepID=UPI000ADE7668|nr:bifunctional alpha,alpha-trehalose-phosphate synthase (UDP-forming)/trehalose-phosphatase [Oligoflexus tunisiensis]
MNRLFIVSHRLPFSGCFDNGELRLKPSVGGLASGLLPLLNENTIWLGWDGLTQKMSKAQKTMVNKAFQDQGCATVRLPMRAHHAFYNDISNGVFWPLYHNQTGRLPLTLPHWADYQLINRLFADRLAELVKPGDTVWIQDYHLQLLPKMIRDRDLGVHISFFMHIPFPPSEIFRMLPIRDEILEGMLGADTIGFHTQGYADHFKQAVESIVSHPRVPDGLMVHGRKVSVVAAPLGVDGSRWAEIAAHEEGGTLVEAIDKMRQDNPELNVLFSVDRLDYTKGLSRKFLAFERLLELHPELLGKITLIQIAPTSRDELPAYSRCKQQVEQLIGSINGRFGVPGYQPIQYFASAFNAEELGQAYGKINVMLVTPLIDGMNLVAKEFVASRADLDGVLVLSEFAGAVDEMRDALIVNPYDIDATAQAMYQALTMPQSDRMLRMKKLREAVMKFNAREWVQQFFSRAPRPLPAPGPEPEKVFLQAHELPGLVSRLKAPLALFIDYDGTLFPIVRRPELASPDASLMMLLKRLSHTPGIEVHIVSGRRFDELFHWFYRLPLYLHGEHGGISYDPHTRQRSLLLDPKRDLTALKRVHDLFETYKDVYKGLLVEKKAFSIVLHYRMMEQGPVEPMLEALTAEIQALEGVDMLEILQGKKNLEVRAKGISKAHVVQKRMQRGDPISCIAIGDDTTDEDMFRVIQENGMTLRVGGESSKAQYRLRDSAMVREFLRVLEVHLSHETKSTRPLNFVAPAGVK